MILFGRPLTKLFIVSSAFEAINASAKYLRCLGFFYWMLGILNVCRMVTQGLGYSGRAVFSGVMEMLARTIVCLGFVGAFGFTRNLLCGSGCVARRLLLYRTDMSVLREEIHENDCGSRCEIITLFSVLQRLARYFSRLSRQSPETCSITDFGSLPAKSKKRYCSAWNHLPRKTVSFFLVFQRYRSIPSLAARPLSNGCLIFQLRNIVRPLNQRLRWSLLPCQNHFQLLRLVIQKNPEGAAHQTVCFQSYKPARPETGTSYSS